jgi:hypothetical protein
MMHGGNLKLVDTLFTVCVAIFTAVLFQNRVGYVTFDCRRNEIMPGIQEYACPLTIG